jgi:predicted O-methyltransferase YrrM
MLNNYPDPATDYESWQKLTETECFPTFVELLCAIRDAIGFVPKRIFDYGYGWGISQCLWLTSFPSTVTCCDPLVQGGYATDDPVAKLPYQDRWTFIQDTAENVLITDIEPFDFIFVDADHAYQSTLDQIRLSWKKLLPGGVMAGHDWHYPSVQGAVNEFMMDKVLRGSVWDIDNGGWMIRKEK